MAARNSLKLLSRALWRSTHNRYAQALVDGFPFSTPKTSNAFAYEQMRDFTSSLANRNLAKVLGDEIKYEKENYQPIDVIKSGPPAPFTLTEEPDDTLLTLKRKFNDEDISVDLHVNNQPEAPYEEDEAEDLTSVSFNVTITKADKSLIFQVESDGTDIQIMHASFEPKSGEQSESYYYGPVFNELDDTLQGEFKSYLQARGINSDLGEYLRHLIYDKEQREYRSWLQKVRDFVSA